MGMDRNTVIGFVLIGLLMAGMLYFNQKGKSEYEAEQKRIADSIAALQPKIDTSVAKADIKLVDSLQQVKAQGSFVTNATQQMVEVENNLVKIAFDTKGAQPRTVTLKNYKRKDGSDVVLLSGKYNRMSYAVNTGANEVSNTGDLIFSASPIVKNADGSQTINFTAGDSAGKQIVHSYTLKPNDYMVDFNIGLKGAANMFTGNEMNLEWKVETPQLEMDHKYELQQTHIGYKEKGEFNDKAVGTYGDKKDLKFSDPVAWLALRQQFFINAILAKNNFSSAQMDWSVAQDTSNYLMQTVTFAKQKVNSGNDVSIPMQLYFGPSDYRILQAYNNNMQELVPFGSGVFSFVKYINRYFLLPVFEFLRNNVASMGIVILLLTLIIRLITSPILYNSYLSGAKMKALKPEVDQLRSKFTNAKTGDFDQQGFGMEQMKLWRSAGVNPASGCIPALLQIPIFMSLYYFFNSNIALRGKNFLWAQDLASYDSILKLPFHIPMYGDHVSLFALTASITSLLISVYSMQQMQDQTNPVMKYMPYIMPVFMLLFFNSLPSALNWYYTVSNTITLILQFVIQKYIINHDKILEKINENKKKPVKKSKIAERLEAMQEAQKKLQEQQAKINKNKSS